MFLLQKLHQLMGSRRAATTLDRLTAREREVLGLMAGGHSNSALAEQLCISEGAVEKHIGSIFGKLDLPPTERVDRRVTAVLRYLEDVHRKA